MTKLPDDDPRKWKYSEHTRAKHEILTQYLDAWYSILGSSRAKQLIILDGFAGRGRYTDGEAGSPALIHDAAVRAVARGVAQQITILCSEANPSNFESLQQVTSELDRCDGVDVRTRREEFAAAGGRMAEWLSRRGGSIPTFVFIDPFGFTGVPLETIKALLAVEHVEVLLTFMARDMSRFLTLESVEAPLTEFFGGAAWRQCTQPEQSARTECLLLRYQEVIIQPKIALFATPFRVLEDARQATLYYLVHLTNHPLGMRRMKEAMVSYAADMTFWPITRRPRDQLALDVSEGEPWPSLQEHLLNTYRGRSLTFEQLLNEDYPQGVWIQKQYRSAVLDLERRDDAPLWVTRGRSTPSGRAPRGLKHTDIVKFG